MDASSVILWIGVLIAVLIFLFLFAIFFVFFRIWLKMFLHGRPVSFIALIGMRLRGAPMGIITDAYAELIHAGSKATIADIERAFHANPSRVRSSGDLAAIVRSQKETHSK